MNPAAVLIMQPVTAGLTCRTAYRTGMGWPRIGPLHRERPLCLLCKESRDLHTHSLLLLFVLLHTTICAC